MDKSHSNDKSNSKISRRDVLKGLSTFPVLGILTYDFWKKKVFQKVKNKTLSFDFGLNENPLKINHIKSSSNTNQLVRIGIIGTGIRGIQLLQASGFMDPDKYNQLKNEVISNNKSSEHHLNTYLNQELLNIQIVGICDVFDLHAEKGINISTYGIQPNGETSYFKGVKKYYKYQDMLANPDIDAVIISTPDFHHAQMIIDSVNAGKHIYCEKAMTLTEDELHNVYDKVKKSSIVFQLGNQNSKNPAFKIAKEIVDKNILGKVTLIETTTNRNSKEGAWIRHLDNDGNLKPGSLKTIDWNQWLGNTPKVPFSIERYYGWARWFAYDTGLSGQLFSHEIDAVNQIMGFGIPKTVTSSGGIYFHKEERDMPDTFQSVLEFPDKEFTLLYSASLANSRSRGRVFMGHDASMEVGGNLKVIANIDSTKYKNKIDLGLINPEVPIYTYPKQNLNIDGITSASEKYYADRGLLYTKIEQKNYDITYLHVKEWLDVIRNGGTTGCDIEKAFDNTVSVLMVHKSYIENRKVEWDPIKRRIV